MNGNSVELIQKCVNINIMFEIINYRYLNFLPIIVSSEFSIDKLLVFDEGVGSRIYEMSKDYVVEIEKDVAIIIDLNKVKLFRCNFILHLNLVEMISKIIKSKNRS